MRAGEWRMCGRKVRYHTSKEASKNKNIIQNRRGVALRVYDCDICEGWHLTKSVRRAA